LPDEDQKTPLYKVETKPSNKLGISVADLTDEQRETLENIKNGVFVQDVENGVATDAGIQPGDVILRIQNNVIRNTHDFDKIVRNLPVGKSVAVLIQRRGSPVFLALKIDK